MKISSIFIALVALASLPAGRASAQTAQTDRAYVGGVGGFAIADDTSGQVAAEAGVRVAPHVFVFGNVGQFHNLSSSQLQPAIDDETATLLNTGLTVTGTATTPTFYTTGGVRVQIPTRGRVTPYFFGGVGFAHLMPTAHFTYTSGTLTGATPNPGDDVTTTIVGLGDFTQPVASNALMVSTGGGVETAIAPHVTLDVGYKYSRVDSDTPINAQSVLFGVGYHF